ncbi:hypothetical protein ABPG72_021954 [Tetrahymena utriculariae]
MSNSRQQTSQSKQAGNVVERRVTNQVYSYNPLVDPPGYFQNTQTATQMPTQTYQQSQMQQQNMMPQAAQYQPTDRNYFEQNLLQINDQMSNINSYNQQAVNHNQMLIEMQENKLNSLMNDVKKLKDGGGQAWTNGKNLNKDRDLENLMMINAFDDSLANTRLYYGENLYNQYGRNAKTNLIDQISGNSIYPGGGMQSRNMSQPLINPEQKFRKQVFGGFGELFWDEKGNPSSYQPQQYNNYNIPQQLQNSIQNAPISAPTQPYPAQQQPPQQFQQQLQPQSVFQRNSSQILNMGNPYQQQLPRSPQVQQIQLKKSSAYDIPNRQTQTPMKSTAYSLSALDNQPPNDDPLVNLLIKQGQLMENISNNIDKETKKQEKNDVKRLKKKLDQFEEKQKQVLQQEEYNNMYPSKSQNVYQNNPYEVRNIFDPNYQLQNLQNYSMGNPMMTQSTLPLQLMLSLVNQNYQQANKQSRLEQIKTSMLMRKLAIENELLKQGKAEKQSSKKSKNKKKNRKSKRKNRRAGDDDDDDDDLDEDDYYYDSEDDDWDSEEDYYDEDEDLEQQNLPPPPKVETEEEKKKREEEELKKKKEERIKNIIKKIKIVSKRAFFPILYFKTIRMQIEEKKKAAYKKINEDMSRLKENVQNWVEQVSSRGLNLILDVKASCDISKKLSEKEMKKRVDNLKLRVKALLDSLADNCKEEDLGNIAVQIFGTYINSFNFPPQQQLYKFEINRLKFTYFGALNDMNARQQQMLLLVFIVIKVLILVTLNTNQKHFEKLKDSNDLKMNLKVIKSVIYEILIEYLRNTCPPIQNNQVMLSADKKIKETPTIPMASNDPVDPQALKDAQKYDEPIVLGLFSRNQLEQVFQGIENTTWMETMKSTLQGLGESLVSTINKKYEEMRAKQREEEPLNDLDQIKYQKLLQKYQNFVKSQDMQQIFNRQKVKEERKWNDNPNVQYNKYEHLRSRINEYDHIVPQNNELVPKFLKKNLTFSSNFYHPSNISEDKKYSSRGFYLTQKRGGSQGGQINNQIGFSSQIENRKSNRQNTQLNMLRQQSTYTPKSTFSLNCQFNFTQSSFQNEIKKQKEEFEKSNLNRSTKYSSQCNRDYSLRDLYYQHIKYDKNLQNAFKKEGSYYSNTISAAKLKSQNNERTKFENFQSHQTQNSESKFNSYSNMYQFDELNIETDYS